ncbi:MAG TPA: hypothetical protein PKW82_07125, partial [Spirochaetales bacterium]|nr:hypothetical protein [Spirochaetales bacterium]
GESITGGELATDEVQAGDLIIPAAIGAALDQLLNENYLDDVGNMVADLALLFDGDEMTNPTIVLFTEPEYSFLAEGSPLANILLVAGFDIAALMGGS